ncbi:MAG: UDP-N-acetylmuramoyl-L-alanyl-D-glutamate--2,6-diaminopimelate ligase [bacterium]|nr:UDP-N-acetylmuramoyl-L-alanyl-D-glutamate--2,6-diaminopimelate ligase [bacterium]
MPLHKFISELKKSDLAHTARYVRGVTAAVIHSLPANKMTLIGVTGTDGKTTTCNLIYHMLKSSGIKVGMISTISAKIFNGKEESDFDTGFHVTSPDSMDVQGYLKKMIESGCTHAILECTSHALVQNRYAGINFDVGVVTNITHEHLDYHKTYDKYVLAKGLLFRHDSNPLLKQAKKTVAILNQDDKSWELLIPYTHNWDRVGYGTDDFSQFHIINTSYSLEGSTFILQKENDAGNPVEQYNVTSNLLGLYNIYNITAALATISYLGIPVHEAIVSLSSFYSLPGRFERFPTKEHGTVVVDFAHTPNALHQLLSLGREVEKGKSIVVFGCASERDESKRPLMGEVAAKFADVSILTAEDPRNESVESINMQIAAGAKIAGAEEFKIEPADKLDIDLLRPSLYEHLPVYLSLHDRKDAIEFAIRLSQPGDMVFVCGKGHEKSMNCGNGEEPWSDQDAVHEIITTLES